MLVMGLLAAMIGVCILFWAVAAAHPDPVVGDPWPVESQLEASP
jgi:hypothetical protein